MELQKPVLSKTGGFSGHGGFISKQQELLYQKLLEKLLSYVSFKLITVMKLAEANGLSV